MKESLLKLVISRSRERCEYCLLTSLFQVEGFEVDHVIPRSRGGQTVPENLAYACPHCNVRKLNHLQGRDPEDGTLVDLFHPRTQNWHDHFEWSVDAAFQMTGKTPWGRATIQRLDMNAPQMVRLRALLAEHDFDCRKADFV